MTTRMFATVMVALVLVSGVMLGLAGVPASTTLAQPKHGTLVYHWYFKNGMGRWISSTTGWTVSGGVLRYDGKNNSMLKSPYELPSYLSNFAVVAKIKGVARVATGPVYGFGVGAYYGLDPLTFGTNGGYGCFYCQHPGAYVWSSFTRARKVMAVPAGFHTYRLEVRDRQYTLLMDGKKIVQATVKNAMVGPALVIYASLYRIEVKAFRVFSLQ